MPDPRDPHIAAQLPPLRGPAFDPDEHLRPAENAHFEHWQDLVDKRLIGNIPQMSPEQLAAIDGWERVHGVGKYRWR